MTLDEGIRSIYVQVDAPDWAARNLDALVDVLRDLDWLPERPIEVLLPDVDGSDGLRLRQALELAVAETADGPRPVTVRTLP
jgi:hypothetical protein